MLGLQRLNRNNVFRKNLPALAKIVTPLAILGCAIALPVEMSTPAPHAGRTASAVSGSADALLGAARTASGSGSALSVSAVALSGGGRRALIAPLADTATLSRAAAVTAAQTCVKYATQVGWANNGYYAGDLVTAAAVCVAESAGDPSVYLCNPSGTVGDYSAGQPINCPTGTTSYDRGLWQLNSVNASTVTDSCAFNPVCNASRAYTFSQLGTDFEPWASYDSDNYARYIDAAQAAVNALPSGTVTSALLGSCLAPAKSAANQKVVIANCGSGGVLQQWTITGGRLKSGSVCAAIGSGSSPGVVLRKCASTKAQSWAVAGRYELRNAADGKCLTDPNSSLTPGTQVNVTTCANRKNQTWWLP